MLRFHKLFAFVVFAVSVSSCEQLNSFLPNFNDSNKLNNLSSIDFGEIEHYPSFLWEDGNRAILNTTITTGFNEASANAGSFAVIEFQDEKGQVIRDKEIIISFNNEPLSGASYKLDSSPNKANRDLNLSIEFGDLSEAKKFSGYLAVKQSNLDRVNDTPLSNTAISSSAPKILSWKAEYTPVMNPLKKWVLAISLVIATFLLLRLTIIKRKLYPVFSGTVRYLESTTQSRSINFNGYRQVVLSTTIPKQSLFDRLWRGKVLYIKDPSINSPIEFTPKKKGAIKYRFAPDRFSVSPSDIFLQKGIEYKIKNSDTKQTVTLK
jgi:hypothetical protein